MLPRFRPWALDGACEFGSLQNLSFGRGSWLLVSRQLGHQLHGNFVEIEVVFRQGDVQFFCRFYFALRVDFLRVVGASPA